MAELNVNYAVTGLDPLTNAIESLQAKLTDLGNNLSGDNANNDIAPGDKNIGANKPATNPMEALAEAISKSSAGQTDLITQLKTLSENINKLSGTGANAGRGNPAASATTQDLLKMRNEAAIDRAKALSDIKIEEVRQRDQVRSERRSGNVFAALAGGSAAMLAYQAGTFGATAGSASGIINTGFLGTIDFQKEQYKRQQTNNQSLITTGVGLGIGAASLAGYGMMAGAGLGPVGAAVGAVGGAVIGGTINYFTNKDTEEKKIRSDKIRDQDTIAWRLNATGLSRYDGSTMSADGISVPITGAQRQSMTGKDALYNPSFGDVTLGMRRDQAARMDGDQKVAFNTQINTLAKLTGNSDIQGLGNVTAMYAATTGKSPIEASKGMMDSYLRSGGDTAANTAKIVQLLQQTPLKESQARDIVERWQYNEPMLNAKAGASTTTPNTMMQRYIYAKLDPLNSEADAVKMATTGIPTPEFQKRYFAHLKSAQSGNFANEMVSPTIMSGNGLSNSMNMFVNPMGEINPLTGPINPKDLNPTQFVQQAIADVSKALENITVTNQTVNVTGSFNVNGNTGGQTSNAYKINVAQKDLGRGAADARVGGKPRKQSIKDIFEHGSNHPPSPSIDWQLKHGIPWNKIKQGGF